MATIEVILYCLFIGVPAIFFIYWFYGVMRYLIIPNRKVIWNFFAGISRALVIGLVITIGLVIAALIYHYEVPDDWYYGTDKMEIKREYNPFKVE